MAEEINYTFNRGDFLRKDNKKGSFMIYEGNNLSTSSYKKMSLVCFYDPEKYVMGNMGYEQRPHLEVGSETKPCSETIDTDHEDFWIKVCNEAEKKTALKILSEYGFHWNEETLELVDAETGEIVRKVHIPDGKYYGQIIRPINTKSKDIIRKYCLSKSRVASYNSNCCGYDDYYE